MNTAPVRQQSRFRILSKQDLTAPAIKPQRQEYSGQTPHIPVQPFKTKESIEAAKSYFLNRPQRYANQNIRDWCIFVLGINLARRAGDLLNLRLHNVLDENGNIKTHINIIEEKTKKVAQLYVTPVVRAALTTYLSALNALPTDYLFPSRNRDCKTGKVKSMTVQNYYKKLKQLKTELALAENIGTHSMRKSWGYMAINNNPGDALIVAKISRAYNHSNVETTFRYLGIEQEELDQMFLDNQL